ncbi:capsular biosynthesis protein [Exiguobacterium sp. SL-10]|uniref:YveK family protein n=1 Tax=unclassified Exiguobacterium TaxID=2644629 RepID=UPI00103F9EBB|nr:MULTISPECIES: Wzz/FepE/Etk N-terminal domain-containing protein [unclassified Exiguobacterium]TCI22603.1 capsular biosynthesis protein [Exiguobacterium sp. SL-9]TCI30403.1 capsular biosynthesis protein [Exiguobacterium sp. SL-10]
MKSQTMLLSEIFGVLKKNILILLLMMLMGGGAAYYLSQYVIAPTYEASTQVLIVPKEEAGTNVIDSAQVSSSLSLVNTYRVIMRSPAILNEVQDRVGEAPADISEILLVESEEDSQVINIVVQYVDPVVATEIANVITRVFASEIPDLMNIDNVRILSEAVVPGEPIAPNVVMNTAVGLLVGFVVGGVLALIRHTFDKRIHNEREAEQILSMPVIGSIPVIEKRDMNPKVVKPKADAGNKPKGDDPHVPPVKETRQTS